MTSAGGNITTPVTTSQECNNYDVIIVEASVNLIYECDNKEQLIKYYHAALGSHTKTTLITAAKTGYLQGCPSLTAEAVNKFIGVKTGTKMGNI